MRKVWKRPSDEWRGLYLLTRMHLLRTLFARNEKRLPELRWRTAAPAAATGRGVVASMGRESAGHRTLRIVAWLFAVTYLPLIPILNFALSCICFLRQLSQVGKEGWRLADEKSHIRQELERAHGDALCLGRSNDRTRWEVSTQKRAWFRHDQALVEQLVVDCQVRKGHRNPRYRVNGC